MLFINAFLMVFTGIRDVIAARSLPHSHLRDRLLGALTVTVLVDLLASALLLHFENGASGSNIATYWDSFYFVTAQLTTLSSSMANPVTFAGEALCLFIDIYAITVVTTLAGMFGVFFAHRSMQTTALSSGQTGGQHGELPPSASEPDQGK